MPLISSYDNPHQPPIYNWELRLTTGEIWDQPRPSTDFCDLFDLGHTVNAWPSYGFGMDQVGWHGACPRKEHTDACVAILVKKDAYKTPKWIPAQLMRLSLVLSIANLNMTLLLGVI